ncbi:hypothetical protein P7K49_020577 [Saguinus oedipus]|uniref:Uncharacterized protein n=1 Tax=Saguinus oedipus TaxID=9490 RepID=A0ABQ9V1E5_SAGOE|nr:hypothetical protein P7K49_020577 [Saguinus oedipus]
MIIGWAWILHPLLELDQGLAEPGHAVRVKRLFSSSEKDQGVSIRNRKEGSCGEPVATLYTLDGSSHEALLEDTEWVHTCPVSALRCSPGQAPPQSPDADGKRSRHFAVWMGRKFQDAKHLLSICSYARSFGD